MTDQQLEQARNIIKKKPYLLWSSKNFENLSAESILESILNFGDWPDFIELTRVFGISKTSEIFNEIKNRKRSNLRPQTVNYFIKYFNQYAQ